MTLPVCASNLFKLIRDHVKLQQLHDNLILSTLNNNKLVQTKKNLQPLSQTDICQKSPTTRNFDRSDQTLADKTDTTIFTANKPYQFNALLSLYKCVVVTAK